MTMLSGLFLPIFDEFADPAVVAGLSVEAEEAGWHGVFVWDHVRWREPVRAVADPWITLAAVAAATGQVRLGPMVTPLARRRPVKVARETATLDRLSGGRLTLGAGLGSDRFGSEFSITGEETGERRRAQMLDESLEILTAAWSGEPVHHRGEHYTVDGMRFLPRPVQRPGCRSGSRGCTASPGRCAGRPGTRASCPSTSSTPASFAEIVAGLAAARQAAGTVGPRPCDVVATLPPGADPAPYAAAGATWWLVEFPAEATPADLVRGVIRDGPAAL
jgi:alkanesulfonate monooxygenase SsuD/methylene tetrahydromethanopterin reductase-like flavin-dependent oxidoreductase (luciferase family)